MGVDFNEEIIRKRSKNGSTVPFDFMHFHTILNTKLTKATVCKVKENNLVTCIFSSNNMFYIQAHTCVLLLECLAAELCHDPGKAEK